MLAFLKKEFLEVLPPTLFFAFVFHVVLFARTVMGADQGEAYVTSSATAFVGALIVGKAVLIADATPFAHHFRERRLIYNIAWRSALYLLVALFFQLLEELIPLVRQEGGLGPALSRFGQDTDWRVFWATHLVLGVFIVFYTFVTALIDLIGSDRFVAALLGPVTGTEDDAN